MQYCGCIQSGRLLVWNRVRKPFSIFQKAISIIAASLLPSEILSMCGLCCADVLADQGHKKSWPGKCQAAFLLVTGSESGRNAAKSQPANVPPKSRPAGDATGEGNSATRSGGFTQAAAEWQRKGNGLQAPRSCSAGACGWSQLLSVGWLVHSEDTNRAAGFSKQTELCNYGF